MNVICPFCLLDTPVTRRCPACDAVLPQTMKTMEFPFKGGKMADIIREDASGLWMRAGQPDAPVLVWLAPEGVTPGNSPEREIFLAPDERGVFGKKHFCVWPMPQSTLPREVPMAPREAHHLWEAFPMGGLFGEYMELLPFEWVSDGKEWRILAARPAVPEQPVTGTLFAPERLKGDAPGQESCVFLAAAWFHFMLSGELPVGLVSPPSGRKKNLDHLDVLVLGGLSSSPERRKPLPDFSRELTLAVRGKTPVQWVFSGFLFVLGLVFLVAWVLGVIWAFSVFDLLK